MPGGDPPRTYPQTGGSPRGGKKGVFLVPKRGILGGFWIPGGSKIGLQSGFSLWAKGAKKGVFWGF